MSFLTFKKSWLTDNAAKGDALDATHARLQICLGKQNITEYKIGRKTDNKLEIPLYYLAEWLAENWWVILFEPMKDEENDDPGFIRRHSILSAQHGFPLPALSIIPFGRSIRLNCSPRKATFANVSFFVDAFGDESTDDVQNTLSKFLNDSDERLRTFGIEDTNFQAAWNEISNLSPEEKAFCELIGSLGLAPSCVNDEISNAVEKLLGILGPRAVRDFCLAVAPAQVLTSMASAEEISERLPKLTDAKLDALIKTDLPSENFKAPSWRRGMQAAKNLREKLGIDVKDENGATKIFEVLNIDLSHFDSKSKKSGSALFSGAIDRQGNVAKIALLAEGTSHRRFAAGRATYLTWVSGNEARRLMTNAVTRDQQASRQFAAEILVPQSYLKVLAQSKGKLSHDHVIEIAQSRGAMPDVAFKQAYNAGISVAAI